MKTLFLLITATLGLALAGTARAAAPDTPTTAKPAPVVTVIFDHPDTFSDVRDAFIPTQKGEQGLLDAISRYVQQRGAQYLPPGCHLTVTFTNIDLAGDFEPWHGSGFDDVRFMRNIYPPRFDLRYQITDPAGKVVKSGERHLLDLDYLDKININTNDSLRYDKALLDDWLREDVKGAVKP